jgi:nitrogen-specific signal transduction histidine kinase
MFERCCATCEYLFEVCDSNPVNIGFCPTCQLPRLVLDIQGKAIKWDTKSRSRFKMHEELKESCEVRDLFKVFGANSPEYSNAFEEAFHGRRVRLELCRSDLPDGDILHQTEKSNLLLIPLKYEETVIAVGLVYYSEIEAQNGFHSGSADRFIKELIQSVAEIKHDLNNPILLIMGNAQLILAKPEELSSDVRRKLQKILSSAERIRETLDQLQVSTGALCLSHDCKASLD